MEMSHESPLSGHNIWAKLFPIDCETTFSRKCSVENLAHAGNVHYYYTVNKKRHHSLVRDALHRLRNSYVTKMPKLLFHFRNCANLKAILAPVDRL